MDDASKLQLVCHEVPFGVFMLMVWQQESIWHVKPNNLQMLLLVYLAQHSNYTKKTRFLCTTI